MDNTPFVIKSASAVIVAACSTIFGGADLWLKTLIAVIALDYATGVLGAWVKRELNSRVGFAGIGKKMMILCVVALAARMDMMLNASGALRGLAIGFYVANDALSVLENAVVIGVPVPKALVDKLQQFKGDNGGD